MGKIRILMLGGTTEATATAQVLTGHERYDVVISLAGRTAKPSVQPVPTRIGGFGGAEGLAAFLRDGGFNLLIDATHPFAARISQNASKAVATVGIPAFALRRAAWTVEPGDNWTHVANVPEAISALGSAPRRVFLAIGRQEAYHAQAAPQHFYLARSIDPVEPPIVLPDVCFILDRGPFDIESETRLLATHRIDAVIAKNSGGSATYAKIAAARHGGIEVLMIARAPAPSMRTVTTAEAAVAEIDHLFPPDMKRGV
ncbi:cobalt-precorrin-6X reductase [Rhizobium sp. Root1203]|uniref:cobalt-precorrin-6A reductase n=1 Tax=Rhizobium sp. Root1203 TaxID=1736427 RepID=UPI00070D7983|nr:cobalt-precorrin-6A reductase [Rhizobium sp. Root1203]KQV16399.1 cobalt-precorrin-6X reductase [Rhizobium sp. Root1203]